MRTITLSGPGKNALGTELMSRTLGELESARGEAILLTGAGDAFSAGLHLTEVASLEAGDMARFLVLLETLCLRLYQYPGPTVACVNGHAIAGGCLLALCCDYRVSTDAPRARIGLNEVAIGLRFPPQVFSIVQRRLSPAHLTEVVLGAGLYTPTEACRVGLVDEVCADPLEAATRKLALLEGYPRDAYALTKRDIQGSGSPVSEETQAEFMRDIVPLWTSEPLRARLRAILKK